MMQADRCGTPIYQLLSDFEPPGDAEVLAVANGLLAMCRPHALPSVRAGNVLVLAIGLVLAMSTAVGRWAERDDLRLVVLDGSYQQAA